MNLLRWLFRWLFPRPLDVVERALAKREWRFLRPNDAMVLSGTTTPPYAWVVAFSDDQKRRTLLIHFVSLNLDTDESELEGGGLQAQSLKVHESLGHSPELVARVCERLLAENFRLVLGRFERDPDDGEIRFAITLPYRNRVPTTAQIDWCITIGLQTVGLVMPQIRRLAGPAW